jgi:non-ribosomal peptide synthetase component F
VLQLASPSFDASVWEIWMALANGAALHLADRDALLPGPGLARLLGLQRITHLTITPSALAALPEEDLMEPGRFPWLGAEALGPAVVGGTYLHYHEDHEPDIRAWLARD